MIYFQQHTVLVQEVGKVIPPWRQRECWVHVTMTTTPPPWSGCTQTTLPPRPKPICCTSRSGNTRDCLIRFLEQVFYNRFLQQCSLFHNFFIIELWYFKYIKEDKYLFMPPRSKIGGHIVFVLSVILSFCHSVILSFCNSVIL